MKSMLYVAALAAAYTVTPNVAQAEVLQIANGMGCLDSIHTLPSRAKKDGFDVISWAPCHGGESQNWKFEGDALTVTIRGKKYYLDALPEEKISFGPKSGFNLFVTQIKSDSPWQKWRRNGNEISTNADNKKYCLDVVVDKVYVTTSTGKGYNVIAWPDCHRRTNQQWTTKL